MKFTLIYDGLLPPNGSSAEKWSICKYFNPQLKELWEIHPSLRVAVPRRFVPRDQPFGISDIHHIADDQRAFTQLPSGDSIDLCASIERRGKTFWQLVRNTHALKCNLDITFLRKEDAGRVYQGGDLDNRLKTLFDALAVPPIDQVVDDQSVSDDPICCLLEDDAVIMGVNIETHRC
jgi:hypothetical protein